MSKKHQDKTEVEKLLTFELETEEIAERGQQVAKAAQELGEITRRAESEKKAWKGKVEAKQLEIDKLLQVIRDGKEDRTVTCQMVRDFERKVVDYVFEGDVRETRPMNAEEMQLEFPDEVSRKRDGKKAAANDLGEELQ